MQVHQLYGEGPMYLGSTEAVPDSLQATFQVRAGLALPVAGVS